MTFGGAFLIPDADATLDFEWGATFSPRNVRAGGRLRRQRAGRHQGHRASPSWPRRSSTSSPTEGPMRDFCASASLLPTRADLVEKGIEFAVRPELSPVFVGQASTVQGAGLRPGRLAQHVEDHHRAQGPARAGVRRRPETWTTTVQGLSDGHRRRDRSVRPTAMSVAVADRRRGPGSRVAAYAFLTPNLVLLGLFVFVPLVGAVVHQPPAHGRLRLRAPSSGLDNYLRLVGDPLFWRSAANTVLFTAAGHAALDGPRARRRRAAELGAAGAAGSSGRS